MKKISILFLLLNSENLIARGYHYHYSSKADKAFFVMIFVIIGLIGISELISMFMRKNNKNTLSSSSETFESMAQIEKHLDVLKKNGIPDNLIKQEKERLMDLSCLDEDQCSQS